jgi:superfamily I DNA and/or RNA helicase
MSLANVVAMGLCAKNIVLVGDQMQLSQPIQGVHPGSSGLSALEYLLGDFATVPPERGIFLATTRRMNPGVCGFISDAVYDGRLKPSSGNENQRVILRAGADKALAPAGLRFVPVEHDGCSQKSQEEAARLRQIYFSLLEQGWVDRDGASHPIGLDDILVVSPYNMQVNLLRSTLPEGARVGTVDKFQGQEAPVVLISMATSSGEDMPRNIEFLFSRNRLNVAISRARCLAVIVASPRLLEVPCNRIEQMRLVNTLCWAKSYSEELAAARAADAATRATG